MARGPEVARTLVVVTLHWLPAAKQLVEEAGFGDVEPGAGHKQRGEHDQRARARVRQLKWLGGFGACEAIG